MQKALEMGAVALFGEKYGEQVRMIIFDADYSVELCGGTHVPATGQIGFFKIISEGAIAAGIRRIEAITATRADQYIHEQEGVIRELKSIFKSQKDVVKGVTQLLEENAGLKKQLESLKNEKAMMLKDSLLQQSKKIGPVNFIAGKVDLDMGTVRDLAFVMNREVENLFLLLASVSGDKVNLTLLISESLVKNNDLNAGLLMREIAKEIAGGGGGQPHFATAGGKNVKGLDNAFQKSLQLLEEKTGH